MKHHLIIALTAFLLPSLCARAATETELIVRLAQGDSSKYQLSNASVLSFDSKTLFVKTSTSGAHSLSDIKQLVFSGTFSGSHDSQQGSSVADIPVGTPVDYKVPYGLTGQIIPIKQLLDISSATIVLPQTVYNYTGSAIEPQCVVRLGSTTLTAGTDYTVSYSNNINVGTATITITGTGDYTGTNSSSFTITAVQEKTISVLINGQSITPEYSNARAYYNSPEYGTVVVMNSYALAGTEVEIYIFPHNSYCTSKDSIKPALSGDDPADLSANRKYTLKMPASGNVVIEVTFFKISGFADADVSVVPDEPLVYTGDSIKPALNVTLNGSMLTAGADYTASYTNNVNVGTATVTVTGIGNYSGTKTATFTIKPRSLDKAILELSEDSCTYTGQPVAPECTLYFDGREPLVSGTDYRVTYINNTDPGIAKISVEGIGNYTGNRDTTFVIFREPAAIVWINGNKTAPVADAAGSSSVVFNSQYGTVKLDDYYARDSKVFLGITAGDNYLISKDDVSITGAISTPDVFMETPKMLIYSYTAPNTGQVQINVTFKFDDTVGIDDPSLGALSFELLNRQIVRVTGADAEAPVSVYDARGRQLAVEVSRSTRELLVSLASQPQGLYIIKVNNKTFKVYIK